jgi:hypothetical protein
MMASSVWDKLLYHLANQFLGESIHEEVVGTLPE